MKKKTLNNKLIASKSIFLNIFMLLLIVILLFSMNKVKDFGSLLMYMSTFVLILHIWLGAHYIINYLKAKEDITNYIIDIFLLALLLVGVLYFQKLVIWSIIFALLFTFAIIKYRMIYNSSNNDKIKKYITIKIRNEISAIYLLTSMAGLAYIFRNNNIILLLLQIATFFFQIFFVIWLIFIKKVYVIFNR